MFWVQTLAKFVYEVVTLDYSQSPLEMAASYFRKEWNKTDFTQTMVTFIVAGLRLHCGAIWFLSNKGASDNCIIDRSKKMSTVDATMSCADCNAFNQWARVLYSIVTVIVWLRLFDLVRASKSVGQMTIIFFRMIAKDVYVFFFLVLIISPGFGIAFAALQPSVNFQSRTIGEIFSELDSPFLTPFWGVLGDYDLSAMLEATDMVYPASTVLPLLLFVYVGLTTVVLINLLIAQMSETCTRSTLPRPLTK